MTSQGRPRLVEVRGESDGPGESEWDGSTGSVDVISGQRLRPVVLSTRLARGCGLPFNTSGMSLH